MGSKGLVLCSEGAGVLAEQVFIVPSKAKEIWCSKCIKRGYTANQLLELGLFHIKGTDSAAVAACLEQVLREGQRTPFVGLQMVSGALGWLLAITKRRAAGRLTERWQPRWVQLWMCRALRPRASFELCVVRMWGRGQACTCLFLAVLNFVSLQVQGTV